MNNHDGRNCRSERVYAAWKVSGRWFTLVEMLVVIAIISILASLLMPTLLNAIESGRQIRCTNNQKQVGMAISMYADQYNDFIPAVVTDTVGWTDYWDTTRIWAMVYPQGWGQAAFRSSIFACPTYLAEKPTANVSYALNGWYPNGVQDVLKPHKRSLAIRPSMCLLLGEGSNHFLNGWAYNPGPPTGTPPLFPHKDKMTITFMDGHSSTIYGVDIPTTTSSVFWKGR